MYEAPAVFSGEYLCTLVVKVLSQGQSGRGTKCEETEWALCSRGVNKAYPKQSMKALRGSGVISTLSLTFRNRASYI
jgi:hypothetical protein